MTHRKQIPEIVTTRIKKRVHNYVVRISHLEQSRRILDLQRSKTWYEESAVDVTDNESSNILRDKLL